MSGCPFLGLRAVLHTDNFPTGPLRLGTLEKMSHSSLGEGNGVTLWSNSVNKKVIYEQIITKGKKIRTEEEKELIWTEYCKKNK